MPTTQDMIWSGIREIFSRNWFTRLWVLQEMALGSEVVVMCESKSIPWSELSLLASNLKRTGTVNLVRRIHEADASRLDDIASILMFDRYKSARQEGRFCRLTTACMDARWRQSSSPTDRVYAFLGLMDDQTRGQIPEDYSTGRQRDFWKLYRTVSLLMLKKSSGLLMLRIAASSERILEAPSWCMNLSSAERISMLLLSMYQAGGPAESRDDPNADIHFRSISSDQNRLTLRGYDIDHVSDVVSGPWPDPLLEPKRGENGADATILKWMDDCAILARAMYDRLNIDKTNIVEAVARTWIANLLEDPLKYAPGSGELKNAAIHALISLRYSKDGRDSSEHFPRDITARALRYRKAMHIACNGRKFFCTKKGRLGLGPEDVEVGDQVYLFKGAEVLFLFRRQPDGETVSLVGEAYVHGLMDGEFIKEKDEATKDAGRSCRVPVDLVIV